MMVMQSASATDASAPRTPWHLWVVGILALLWNASGAYAIMMAQAGRLPNETPEELAYYAGQPLWFILSEDVALLTAIAGAVALLLRSRKAVWLFTLSLIVIAINNTYDFSAGTSRALTNPGIAVATSVIVTLAVLELVYARAMRERGVLS